jgi:hypothetical protein
MLSIKYPVFYKRAGFFMADREARVVPTDGICGSVIVRFVRK